MSIDADEIIEAIKDQGIEAVKLTHGKCPDVLANDHNCKLLQRFVMSMLVAEDFLRDSEIIHGLPDFKW